MLRFSRAGDPADDGLAGFVGKPSDRRSPRHNPVETQGLNDVVVRRIFAAGLDLQAALGLTGDHRGASKIWHAMDELDQAVKDIRDTICDRNRVTHGSDAKSTPG